jgi:polysaccharide chain length determinant protein (PEP-CTERM system associated)
MPPLHPGHHDDSARGMGLAGFLEVVRRRRALALLPFLFVITAVASLAFFLPSLWTAQALILVNRPQIPETYVRTSVSSDLEARLLTLSQQVLGPARLQQIIAKHDLYPAERATRTTEEIVDKMRRDIQIKLQDDRDPRPRPEPRTFLFSVAYRATDPVVAAEVTNTLANLFIAENSRLREEQATGTSQFLETQLEDLRRKLVAQERRITEYKERHPGELPDQREANLRALERLQGQLQLASETNRRANERIQLISQSLREIDLTSGMAAGPSGTPADSAAARLAALRQELVALQTRYSDRYPDVVQTREQIRLLEEKVRAEQAAAAAAARSAAPGAGRDLRVVPSNPYIMSLMSQLDQAQVEAKTTAEEMANLRRQVAVFERRLENTPKREQELAVITRDYETTREMFRSLLAKRSEAEIAADLEQRRKGETFQLIEAAGYPERPTGPNRLRLLLVGLALALGASAVAVVLAEQVDTSFRRVEEVRAEAPMPVLSTIPRIATEQDRSRRVRQQRLASAAVAVGLVLVASTSFVVARDNQTLVSLLISEPASSRR